MPSKQSTCLNGGRRVALFRNGSNQAVRIPREFEFPTSEALLFRDGDRLVMEAFPHPPSLLRTLEELEPLDESCPDVDASLLPTDSVDLP